MVVEVAAGALWQLSGHEGEVEDEVPVFSGIGFASRPPTGSDSAEAIVVYVEGAGSHPIVIATRDEDLRRALDAIKDMAADEAAIFNSQARVHVKANGTVEVDDGSGAVALATLADVQALRTSFNGHTHLYNPGPGGAIATAVPAPLAPAPTGTTVLKGK